MPSGPPFDAVLAFSALHWIDPALRYVKPFELLQAGWRDDRGRLRVGAAANGEPFWTDVQQDYRAVGYGGEPPPPPEQIDAWHFPAEAAPLFTEVASRRYPFQVRYSAGDYLAILATQSGTHALGEARRAEFLGRVRGGWRRWAGRGCRPPSWVTWPSENGWRIAPGRPMLTGMADANPRSDRPLETEPARSFGWWDMWVRPEDDPRTEEELTGERDTLVAYLRDRRLTLEMKCSGLDAAGLARRSVPPSDLSLLGLVRHLTDTERYWSRGDGRTGRAVLLPHRGGPRRRVHRRGGRSRGGGRGLGVLRAEVEFAERLVAQTPTWVSAPRRARGSYRCARCWCT